LHAPVVVVHYHNVVWRGVASFNHVDIAKFLMLPSNEKLREEYLDNKGGSSLDILRRISGAEDTDLKRIKLPSLEDAAAFRAIADVLADSFLKYGPALVRAMLIEDEFAGNEEKLSHLELPAAPNFKGPTGKIRKHAMVLIGHRKGLLTSLMIFLLRQAQQRVASMCSCSRTHGSRSPSWKFQLNTWLFARLRSSFSPRSQTASPKTCRCAASAQLGSQKATLATSWRTQSSPTLYLTSFTFTFTFTIFTSISSLVRHAGP
jgi:hypothetical protein